MHAGHSYRCMMLLIIKNSLERCCLSVCGMSNTHQINPWKAPDISFSSMQALKPLRKKIFLHNYTWTTFIILIDCRVYVEWQIGDYLYWSMLLIKSCKHMHTKMNSWCNILYNSIRFERYYKNIIHVFLSNGLVIAYPFDVFMEQILILVCEQQQTDN